MIEQITNFYQSLERRERIIMIGALVASAIALIGVLAWANAESYKTVFTANDASQMQAVEMALEEEGIPYKISSDGFKIEVPVEHVGQARIAAASTDTVQGIELLSNMKLGTSPKQERWMRLQALQGELTKTINSLEEVAGSRVHIVEAEQSAFMREAEQSSASVKVKLHPGRQLSSGQIQGITALVAGSVKGLKAKQVVLIDDTGELLSGNPDADDGLTTANTLLQARKNHERQYKKTILNHLMPILGSSSDVSVAVTVDVVSSSTEKMKHTKVPNSQVTLSEKIRESSKKDETPVGIPGAESNLPEQAPAAEEASSDEKFESATNYGFSTVDERVTLAPGAPEKVSASVLVNSLALQKLSDASGGATSVADLKKEIQAAVASAVGYSQERGDQVQVSYVPFQELNTDTGLVSEVVDWEKYIKYALMLLVVLLIFVFVVRPIITTYTQTILQPNEANLTPEQLAALEDSEGGSLAMARRLRRMVDNFETIDSQELNRLVEMHEQPTAEVIRRWLRAS